MRLRSLGALLLLTVVAWRAVSSAVVLLLDTRAYGRVSDLALTTDERIRRGLLLQGEEPGSGYALRHFQAIREHVPEDGQLYVLARYEGALGLVQMRRFFRILWLSYPRYLQPITALPLPPSAAMPPLSARPVFLLDWRDADPPEADAWELVAQTDGARLYRRRGDGPR